MSYQKFDKAMWVIVAMASISAWIAVVFFDWEPSSRILASTLFYGLAVVARARFILVDTEYKQHE